MRILQIIQRVQLRGAEIFACHLASELRAQGHFVKVVALQGGDAELPWPERIVVLDANFHRRFYDIAAWKKLKAEIDNFRPDIVQANAGDTLKYAVMTKLVFRYESLLVFRNASMISLYIKSLPVRLLNSFLFSRADRIISASNASRLDFVRLFPKLRDRVSVVPVGIKLTTASIAKTGRRIIHIGGFSFEKNHRGLIRIYRKIREQFPEVGLLLVGDGPLKARIMQDVGEGGLADAVDFAGAVRDPLPLLASSAVLVLPSIIEGLPSVILEAFSVRVPVVAYDVGGISELLINDKTGTLVPADDEATFAFKVAQILADPGSVGSMVEKAYALVTSEYLISSVASSFLRIYRDGKSK